MCFSYFGNMRETFRQNAAICARETHLIGSLVTLLRADGTALDPTQNGRIHRRTVPDLFAMLKKDDPRWRHTGDIAEPVCALPLRVESQYEAFTECARVYLCGAIAAQCGQRNSAGVTNPQLCPVISGVCLQANPVPMRAGR